MYTIYHIYTFVLVLGFVPTTLYNGFRTYTRLSRSDGLSHTAVYNGVQSGVVYIYIYIYITYTPLCLLAWCEVEGEMLQTEQQPANAEARAQATELLRELHAQRDGHRLAGSDSVDVFPADNDQGTLAGDDGQANSEAIAFQAVPEWQPADISAESAQLKVAGVAPIGKPLVEAPEFGDRVRDTDKEAYWIPGAFPNIFQNQTGDLHNYYDKEPDMLTWGPHIMRSRGWYAQDLLIC